MSEPKVLMDPTPQELGEHIDGIADGTVVCDRSKDSLFAQVEETGGWIDDLNREIELAEKLSICGVPRGSFAYGSRGRTERKEYWKLRRAREES